jgi:LemA protein
MSNYLIIGIPVLILFIIIAYYNRLVRRRNETDNAFGSVDVMLKKRFDLIPNLVETVKQYMTHEASTLNNIVQLRGGYSDQLSNDEKVELHNNISKKLNNMMFLVENYPDLKANQTFLQLQGAWNESEEQIAASRRYYNAAVTSYNNSVQTFPAIIIASMFGFSKKSVFEIEDTERKNIDAKKLFSN